MTIDDIFKRLLERYGFVVSIPEKAQDFVIKSRKKVLKSTLKAAGNLDLFYRFIISVYYDFRLIGLKPSLSLSKLIAVIISIIVSLIFVSGIVFAANNYGSLKISLQKLLSGKETLPLQISSEANNIKSGQTRSEDILIEKSVDKSNGLSTRKPEISDRVSESYARRLGICLFTASGVKENEVSEISAMLYKDLRNLRGSSVVYLAEKRAFKSVNRQLVGRLSRVGKTYVIGISVVDSESGNVLYSKAIKYNNKVVISNTIKNLASEIADKAEIWE